MHRLPEQNRNTFQDTSALRLRAAWLYYNRGWTQTAVADYLNISRSSVVRMLDEARARSEVQIWIDPIPGDTAELSLTLEEKYGLSETRVVPSHGTTEDVAKDVGAALGQFLSERIKDDMAIGVTWGRTLSESLNTFRRQERKNTRVVSLLGGSIESRGSSPIDFSWQLASRIGADCFLYLAPLFVDSPETKLTLINQCGLDRLHQIAHHLDLAVINCGDIGPQGSSPALKYIEPKTHKELIKAGAVGEVACSFLDIDGNYVNHPINNVTMSVNIDTMAMAKHIVLASGGAERASAIHATIKRTKCHTLITDESAALALLDI